MDLNKAMLIGNVTLLMHIHMRALTNLEKVLHKKIGKPDIELFKQFTCLVFVFNQRITLPVGT